jgi:hypothetical protein
MKIYSFEKLDCRQYARQLAVWVYKAKYQSHFSTIAYSSTIELLNDLVISNDPGFLTNENYTNGREMIEKQTLMIAVLRKSQQRTKFLSFLHLLNL